MSAPLPIDPADLEWMARALALAQGAIGLSDPNPRVGCVIVCADGHAEGYTQAAGDAHAEIMALRAAQAAGLRLAGASAYVTLEPCAHHGRTGPCCEALIAAGVARVVVAIADPNPQVAGGGIARLRAAGIAVEVGPMATEARELNIGFFSRMLRQRPWVRMKVAASLDGRTALANGDSQWITQEPARRDGHAWRKRAGAVLTGVGTVLADDPRLDVRWVETALQPLRVVVDSRLQTPASARVLQAPGAALIVSAGADAQAQKAWRERGVELLDLPGPSGKVDLAALMNALAARGINEVHVEAGAKLNASLLREGLVDELLVYLAPKLIGPGQGMAELAPLACLDQALPLEFGPVCAIGTDLRLLARLPGRDRF